MAEDPDRLKILVIRVVLLLALVAGLGFGTNWVSDLVAANQRAEARAALQARVEWEQSSGRFLDSMYYHRLLTAEQHAHRVKEADRAFEAERRYVRGSREN